MNSSPMEEIATNLARVQERIAQAAAKSGRSPDDIELVAVTKTHPAEKIQAAVDAGQILFGESRVQEARAKIPLLPVTVALAFHRAPAEEQNPARTPAF